MLFRLEATWHIERKRQSSYFFIPRPFSVIRHLPQLWRPARAPKPSFVEVGEKNTADCSRQVIAINCEFWSLCRYLTRSWGLSFLKSETLQQTNIPIILIIANRNFHQRVSRSILNRMCFFRHPARTFVTYSTRKENNSPHRKIAWRQTGSMTLVDVEQGKIPTL